MSLTEKLEKRMTELKLINTRVRNSYAEEVKENGLLILEAYYGEQSLIEEVKLKQLLQRTKILMEERVTGKLIDVTDALRYYVVNSKINLSGRPKKTLLGFIELDLLKTEIPMLYIR